MNYNLYATFVYWKSSIYICDKDFDVFTLVAVVAIYLNTEGSIRIKENTTLLLRV